ncbi:hypothetical protein HFO15_19850 [Rhizobium laguerreae]|uniref:hypothetical protein n=1 Tax=Rhizobium laguerreae TaxID=1076926 RepID=UPI001C926990|nr:hypothetical protein [Rhizobium laguerreae]MBY3263882.1 hypothetical protein [Rhizobium laguerreae]
MFSSTIACENKWHGVIMKLGIMAPLLGIAGVAVIAHGAMLDLEGDGHKLLYVIDTMGGAAMILLAVLLNAMLNGLPNQPGECPAD